MQGQYRWFFPLIVLFTVIHGAVLLAQSGTPAALSGTLTDATGAVVPGASVMLTYVTTGAERTTTTGVEGGFLFLQLNTGDYVLSVDAQGFASSKKQFTYEGVPIRLDVALSAAGSNTEVIVTATNDDPTEPAHVDITTEQIERMPTQSVSSPFSSLVTMTTPGVSADSNGSSIRWEITLKHPSSSTASPSLTSRVAPSRPKCHSMRCSRSTCWRVHLEQTWATRPAW